MLAILTNLIYNRFLIESTQTQQEILHRVLESVVVSYNSVATNQHL